MEDALVLRDNAKNELLQIKTLETGLNYLNKVKAIETWAKAEKKDAELQNIIAEQKLRTQRILGTLIEEGQANGEIRKQSDNQHTANSSMEFAPKNLNEVGLTLKESHVFKQIASIPEEKFEEFIEEKKSAVNDAVAELTTAGALRIAKAVHVTNNSGEIEWYTPDCYIVSARKIMGQIDLDPASSEIANKTIKAKKFFDEKSNGLIQKWFGCIWMNPPYSQSLVGEFISKLETETFEQAIILVNNATETKWGQKLIDLSNVICFHSGRIKFVSPFTKETNSPLQGQMIAYIGKNYKMFIEEFRQYGVCLVKGVK